MSGDSPAQELPFGRLLKFWRSVHKLSQEELALRLDSATRHISRLENGRAHPSKAMVENIAKALNLGERDTNHLLFSAGYTPVQRPVDFHDPKLKWLRKAMILTLKAMDPFPTTVMDSATNIAMVNRGWVGLFKQIMPEEELNKVDSHFDFLFKQTHRVQEFEDTLSVILMSLQQTILLSGDTERQKVLDDLAASPNVPKDWQQRAAALEPMASFRIKTEFKGKPRNFYSVSQSVGALGPNAFISEPNLTITTFYPEDEELDLTPLIKEPLSHPLLFY